VILTCVGTGTAAPEPDRVCSGYLVETQGLTLLLDCGGGVVHNLARIGLPWQRITHLFISHFHNDHIGDVPLLFFAWRHGMLPGRSDPLTVIGPKGTRRLLNRMAGVFGRHLAEPGFPVEILEVAGGEPHVRLSDVVVLSTAKTPHTDESLAVRIQSESRALCYTGDTGFSRDVATFAQGVDTLLIECSVPDDHAMETHLSPRSVAEMARIALPRRLLVTHIYPQLPRGQVPGLVRAGGWPARTEIAADGDRIEI
jgi:ribonuclease BN (tRNA processing enzyme)